MRSNQGATLPLSERRGCGPLARQAGWREAQAVGSLARINREGRGTRPAPAPRAPGGTTIPQPSAVDRTTLEQAEQITFLSSILESSTEHAIVAVDVAGTIQAWNEGARRVYGRAPAEVIGKASVLTLHAPDDVLASHAQATLDEARRAGKWEGNLPHVRKDGSRFSAHVTITLRRGPAGESLGFTMISRDLMASQRAQDELRLSNQTAQQNPDLIEDPALLKNVLESSTEYSIIAKDLQGKILTWNEGARRNYGYSAEDMLGRHSSVLHLPEDIASGKVQALQDTAYRTGKAEGTFDRIRKNGEHFTASVAITRRDAAGSPIGYLLISKDVTEQKALEEQLRRKSTELEKQYRRVQEANRLKSEFLANMSHELRTPLNAIIGFAELMHDGKVGPVSADHHEYLGDILTSSRHLLQLINNVLDLSKVESGKMEFRPEPVEVERLVGEVRDILRSFAATKRIAVDTAIDPALGEVVVDPGKLKQVLYNYLSNALKFTPEEGRISIRASPEGADGFRLEIEDTGIGIAPADLPRLFTEFQQLDATAAMKYPGTGLGLALTKRIVEAQGGRVGVRSEPGRGSVFFAVLPRRAVAGVEGEGKEPVTHRVTPPVPHGPTVLVIEDDLRDQRWLARTLSDAGYAVQSATTGAAAIEKARTQVFDAITLDLLLPDMSGREVLRTIRADGANRDTPVLVVTVVAEKGAVAGFHVLDIMTKPVRGPDLVAALTRAHIAPHQSRHVLVVDDSPLDLKLAEKVLQGAGYRTVGVSNGVEALRAIGADPPALVVLDLLMPGIGGFEFLRRLRAEANGRHLPVIVWSSKELSPAEQGQLVAQAQGIVQKGQGAAHLLEEIRALVPDPAATPGGLGGG